MPDGAEMEKAQKSLVAQLHGLIAPKGALKSYFIPAMGYDTHVVEGGSGDAEPLLLIHGGAADMGMGVDRFYPTIEPLSRAFRVFAVDQAGHGLTAPVPALENLGNLRHRAEHLIATIEALGVGPMHIMGQSLGAWLASYIAIKRPDLVRRLILVDSAAASGSNLKKGGMAYFDGIFKPGTMIPILDLHSPQGVHKYMASFILKDAMITPEWVDYLLALSRLWNGHYMDKVRKVWEKGYGSAYTSNFDIDEGVHIKERFPEISMPTLFVWGNQSVKPFEAGIALSKTVFNAELHLFDQANHFLWLDKADEFNGLLTWFLTRPGADR